MSSYFLMIEDCTWKNALCWGNFNAHCKKAKEGSCGHRFVHLVIASLEFFPLVSQIVSIFEKILMNFLNTFNPSSHSIHRKNKTSSAKKNEIISSLKKHKPAQSVETLLTDDLDLQKTAAAIKIQATCRGYLARKHFKNLPSHQAKPLVEELSESPSLLQAAELEQQKTAAAIGIQAACRKKLTQLTLKKEIEDSLVRKVQAYLDQYSSHYSFLFEPRQSDVGVEIPGLPGVLINSTSKDHLKAITTMETVRQASEKNNYSNFDIPQVIVYKNFTIEIRLPIKANGTKNQIMFYMKYRDKFTAVIEEFTTFICSNHMKGLTHAHDHDTPFKSSLGQYNRISLYLEDEIGKIGLLNLEEFDPNLKDVESTVKKCSTLVHLFPYHLDSIMNAAKQFDPPIEHYRDQLEKERDQIIDLFTLICDDPLKGYGYPSENFSIYETHLAFIQKTGISFTNPTEIFAVDPTRVKQLQELVISEVRRNYEKIGSDFSAKNPEQAMALLEKKFPKILDLISNYLAERLKFNVGQTAISSYGQLLFCRTIFANGADAFYEDLTNQVVTEVDMINLEDDFEKTRFASTMIQCLFKELAEGNEIAYYTAELGEDDRTRNCLFL